MFSLLINTTLWFISCSTLLKLAQHMTPDPSPHVRWVGSGHGLCNMHHFSSKNPGCMLLVVETEANSSDKDHCLCLHHLWVFLNLHTVSHDLPYCVTWPPICIIWPLILHHMTSHTASYDLSYCIIWPLILSHDLIFSIFSSCHCRFRSMVRTPYVLKSSEVVQPIKHNVHIIHPALVTLQNKYHTWKYKQEVSG